MTGSLLHQQAANLGDLLSGFYSRRVRRLAPALFVTILSTSLTISALVPPAIYDLKVYYLSGQLALLGMANNYYAGMSTSYEARGMHTLEYNPFTHMWSLGVEEQFYFFFPLIVVFVYGRRVSRASPHVPLCSWPPARVLVLCFALSFFCSMLLSASQQRFAFYLLPSRFWQLILGAMLFEWQSTPSLRQRAPPTGYVSKLSIVGLELVLVVLLVIALTRTPIEAGFPVPWSLPAVAAATIFIGLGSLPVQKWGGYIPSPLLNSLLGCSPVAYIGRLSYPLYLCHWPVFVCLRWTPTGLESASVRVFALCLTTTLSLFLYHGVEGVFRGWKPRRRTHVFAALLLVLSLLETMLHMLRGPFYGEIYDRVTYLIGGAPHSAPPLPLSPLQPYPRPPSSPCTPPPPAAPPQSPRAPPRPERPLGAPAWPPEPKQPPPSPPPHTPPRIPPAIPAATSTLCSCSNNAGMAHTFHSPPDVDPTSTVPCFAGDLNHGDHPIPLRDNPRGGAAINCYFDGGKEGRGGTPEQYLECLTPPTRPTAPRGRVMFVVGDSHGAMMTPAIIRATGEHMMVVAVCRAGAYFSPDNDDDWWFDVLIEGLRRNLRPGDVLTIVQRGAISYLDFVENVVLNGITRPNGASLVLFGDPPLLTRPAPICAAAPNLCHFSDLATSDSDGLRADWAYIEREEVERRLDAFAARHADVYFWRQGDLWTLGPPGEHLWGNVPGTNQRAFIDDSHLIPDIAEAYLWPHLCSQFRDWGLYNHAPPVPPSQSSHSGDGDDGGWVNDDD